MQQFWDSINAVNDIIWHEYVLYFVLGVGILFTSGAGDGHHCPLAEDQPT